MPHGFVPPRDITLAPRVWVLTGNKAGDSTRVLALAEALGWPFEIKQFIYRANASNSAAGGDTRRHRQAAVQPGRRAMAGSGDLRRSTQRADRPLDPAAIGHRPPRSCRPGLEQSRIFRSGGDDTAVPRACPAQRPAQLDSAPSSDEGAFSARATRCGISLRICRARSPPSSSAGVRIPTASIAGAAECLATAESAFVAQRGGSLRITTSLSTRNDGPVVASIGVRLSLRCVCKPRVALASSAIKASADFIHRKGLEPCF